MTEKEYLNNLDMHMELILFSPTTGKVTEYDDLNVLDKNLFDCLVIAKNLVLQNDELLKIVNKD